MRAELAVRELMPRSDQPMDVSGLRYADGNVIVNKLPNPDFEPGKAESMSHVSPVVATRTEFLVGTAMAETQPAPPQSHWPRSWHSATIRK